MDETSPFSNPELEGLPKEDWRLQLASNLEMVTPLKALVVPNVVCYTNANFPSPLFHLNEPTSVGLQLAYGQSDKKTHHVVYGRWWHYRSALLTGNSGMHAGGVDYPYLDIKGVGNINETVQTPHDKTFPMRLLVKPIRPWKSSRETEGLVDEKEEKPDEKLNRMAKVLGVRIVPTVAMATLNQVLDEKGILVNIEEARARKLIDPTITPAVSFRAWVTPYRLTEIVFSSAYTEGNPPEMAEKKINTRQAKVYLSLIDMLSDGTIPEETRKSFINWQGDKEGLINTLKTLPFNKWSTYFNVDNYIRWLAVEIGRQVGILHRNKIVHGYLGVLHNITLDARLVDFDGAKLNASANDIDEEKKELFRWDSLYDFFDGFVELFKLTTDSKLLKELAFDSYDDEQNR